MECMNLSIKNKWSLHWFKSFLLLLDCFSKVLFHLSEEFQLLVFLISNNCSICIIREISCPLNICCVIISNWSQDDLSLDTCSSVRGFSCDNFITDRVLHVTDFHDSDFPNSTIIVVNLNNWVKLAWLACGEFGCLYLSWDDSL